MAATNPMKSDPHLIDEIKALGAANVGVCFNCGTCTATCKLSSESTSFPRRMTTYTQFGLKDKVLESPDLWLCNYCGECSKSCPREAEPAETMMALRRYAITQYTHPLIGRLASKIYKSPSFALTSLILISLIPMGVMLGLHGPINMQSVMLFSFFPQEYIDIFGYVSSLFVAGLLLYGMIRMYLLTSRSRFSPVASAKWLKEFFQTVIHEVMRQRRLFDCDLEQKGWRNRIRTQWFVHMTIFWGFVGLLVTTALAFMIPTAITVPLTNGLYVPLTEPIRLLGTISGLFLVYGASIAIVHRIKKSDINSSHTHFTDWAFLVLLLLTGLSGYVLEVVYYANAPLWFYAILTIHLTVVFDLLIVLPFTKFAHVFYRPLAIWISRTHNYIETSQVADAVEPSS